MEKLITLYPHKSTYKDMFENFNSTLFCLSDNKRNWWKYQEEYGFSATHFGNGCSFENLDWKGMYDNVPEAIELWTLKGTDFGLDTPLRYDEFSKILKGRKFISPPFGTGLWLPQAFAEQNITFEGRLYVYAPIEPFSGKRYKTLQIGLDRSANFQNGKIHVTLYDLRPTETWIDPNVTRIVQRVLD